MPLDGLGMSGAEEVGGRIVFVREAGDVELLVVAEIRHVGPHLDSDAFGRDSRFLAAPMQPAFVGSITEAAKPALVAADCFAAEGLGVWGFAGLGFVSAGGNTDVSQRQYGDEKNWQPTHWDLDRVTWASSSEAWSRSHRGTYRRGSLVGATYRPLRSASLRIAGI